MTVNYDKNSFIGFGPG